MTQDQVYTPVQKYITEVKIAHSYLGQYERKLNLGQQNGTIS